MAYSRTQIRTWSMMGLRGTCGVSLKNLADNDDRIVALSADLRNTSGFDRFASAHSDRFVNVGIAEQNLIGVAAGLADAGKVPFASTFANFATMRGCEFVRHFMGYMGCNVKLVGIGAGFAMELFGNTHYALEDVAAIRAIPGIAIVSPCDGLETVEAVNAIADYEGPVYLRLGGTSNHPVVYKQECDFEIGKANILREGGDIALLANGTMVNNALKTSKDLARSGIETTVIDCHTIVPFDDDCLLRLYANGIKTVFTIEEHRSTGGFGSAVLERASELNLDEMKVIRIGADAGFARAGSYAYMLKTHGLDPESITSRVKLFAN